MARFLVVDDDLPCADALADLLRFDGHTVDAFSSGAEAVKAIANSRFDAVITDLEMPGTDGLAVVRAAREKLPDAFVAVVTSHGGERDEQVLGAGAAIILYKPLEFDDLTRAMDATLLH
jgi:DNA-binding response OmpR family regulator